jgi:thiol-disulfide isomerase/thioredoxin
MAIRWCTVTILGALVGLAVLLTATVGVAGFVRWQQRRPGRIIADEIIEPTRLGADRLGDRATLLQFSNDRCTRCPGVHRTLSSVAGASDGVLHLDVDLTHRPDIAKHFHVMQTPTTLILDRNGMVQARFGGAPRRDVVELELARVTSAPAVA